MSNVEIDKRNLAPQSAENIGIGKQEIEEDRMSKSRVYWDRLRGRYQLDKLDYDVLQRTHEKRDVAYIASILAFFGSFTVAAADGGSGELFSLPLPLHIAAMTGSVVASVITGVRMEPAYEECLERTKDFEANKAQLQADKLRLLELSRLETVFSPLSAVNPCISEPVTQP